MQKMQFGALGALVVLMMACGSEENVPQPTQQLPEGEVVCPSPGVEISAVGNAVVTAHPGEVVVAQRLELSAGEDLTVSDLVFATEHNQIAAVAVLKNGVLVGDAVSDGDNTFRVTTWIDLLTGEEPIIDVAVTVAEKGVGYTPTGLLLTRARAWRMLDDGTREPVCATIRNAATYVDIKRPEITPAPPTSTPNYLLELDASSPIRRKIHRGEEVHTLTFKVTTFGEDVLLESVAIHAPGFDRMWVNAASGELLGSTLGDKNPLREVLIATGYTVRKGSVKALMLTGYVRGEAPFGPTTVQIVSHRATLPAYGRDAAAESTSPVIATFDVVDEVVPVPSTQLVLPAACASRSNPTAVLEVVGPTQASSYLMPAVEITHQRIAVTACGQGVRVQRYATGMFANFSQNTSAWEGFFGPNGEQRLENVRLVGVEERAGISSVRFSRGAAYPGNSTDGEQWITFPFESANLELQPGERMEFLLQADTAGLPATESESIQACYFVGLGGFEGFNLVTQAVASFLWDGGSTFETCFVTP